MTFKPNIALQLDFYVDSDFTGLWNFEDYQYNAFVSSQIRCVLTLGGHPIKWRSKIQIEVTLSTTEAEYVALSQAMSELMPLSRFLLEVVGRLYLTRPTNVVMKYTVFEDNNGVLATARDVTLISRTKNIFVKCHFFKTRVGPGTGLELVKIDTNLQNANILTTVISPETFACHHEEFNVWMVTDLRISIRPREGEQ